uniref:Transmembrane protein n=1 Tax=Schistosoma mansoni TaxID=6183 RepID=A0A3Q0KNT2_SCHMA
MPVEYRQNKNNTSTHLSYYELPHSIGRHYMSQNYNQQNASDRLYQIAIQAAVAKAESSKSTNDEIRKFYHDDNKYKLNKTKLNNIVHTHINNNTITTISNTTTIITTTNTATTTTTTTTSTNLSSKVKTAHLTPQQWQLLNDYHEHDLFVRTRSWSFCMAVLGVGVTLFGIGSPAWKWIGDSRNPYELGLWTLCLPNNSTCLSIIYHLQNNWKLHISIICLLGCACLFGMLGLGLAITGVCKSALILRLYYYHSAGECFLVSSIATITALILYPISAETCIQNLINLNIFKIKSSDHTSTISISSSNNNKNPVSEEDVSLTNIETQFGYTYFLTWIAALFFVNSFICMNLDLLIQSFVRPIPLISSTINNLMPCCGLSTSSLSESPVSSKSSHSSCHLNESVYNKQRHKCTGQNIEKMIISNSNQNTETSPKSNLHSKRKLIKSQREFVSFDDSITENSQHQPYQVPNILLSDYDKECELINSQNKELSRENSINITDEIVVVSDEILQDSGQDGEWI